VDRCASRRHEMPITENYTPFGELHVPAALSAEDRDVVLVKRISDYSGDQS